MKRALQSGFYGPHPMVSAGDVVADDDPRALGWPEVFEDVDSAPPKPVARKAPARKAAR